MTSEVYITPREYFRELSYEHKFAFAFSFAILTAVGAQIKLYTPFTPVPFTFQVFFALTAGVVLGRCYGAISQIIYILLGIVGIPVFANFRYGIDILFGYTGGYIFGFVIASFIVGHIYDKYELFIKNKLIIIPPIIGVGIIHVCGVMQLAYVCNLTLYDAILLGTVPFILFDIVKACMCAGVMKGMNKKVRI